MTLNLSHPQVGRNGVIRIDGDDYHEPMERCPKNIHDSNYIDFPCSQTWREYYNESFYGVYAHKTKRPPARPQSELKPVITKGDVKNLAEQALGLANYTKNKLQQHLDKKRIYKKYE